MQKLNPEVKKKWVEALRSGEYEQTQETLRRRIAYYVNGTEAYAYCCLGVLCDLHRKEKHRKGFDENNAYLDNKLSTPCVVEKWAGLSIETHEKLVVLNDKKGWSFKKIAAYIERYL